MSEATIHTPEASAASGSLPQSWAQVFGGGVIFGGIAGSIAGASNGKLGIIGFVLWLLGMAGLTGWKRFVATLVFASAGGICAAIFATH